jgi:hypothetical protein
MSERDIHITICALLDVYAHPRLIWFHPANGEKRNIVTAMRLKKMGVKRGIPDLAFTLPDGRSAYMEIKTPKGRMSDHQKYYRQKCWDMNVPYALVTCADDAMAILYEWGALLPVAYKRGQRDEEKRNRIRLPDIVTNRAR